jgi:hypothetical protein
VVVVEDEDDGQSLIIGRWWCARVRRENTGEVGDEIMF